MPTLSARIKRNARYLGSRSKCNAPDAFMVAVSACLGEDAPLRGVPFQLKLDMMYRAPKTHIECFARDPATFEKASKNQHLTENATELFLAVHARLLRNSGATFRLAAAELQLEYDQHMKGRCLDADNVEAQRPQSSARRDTLTANSGTVTLQSPPGRPDSVEREGLLDLDSVCDRSSITCGVAAENEASNMTDDRVHSDIATFCSTMGVRLCGPANLGSWVSVLSASRPRLNGKSATWDNSTCPTPSLGSIAVGKLLRELEDLCPGRVSIVDPSSTVQSVRVRRQGMGKVVLPISDRNSWCVITICENRSRATIYSSTAKVGQVIKRVLAGFCVDLLGDGSKTIEQDVCQAPFQDRDVCYLFAVFAAAMNVEPDAEPHAEISQQLWHKFFSQLGQNIAPSPHILWLGTEVVDEIKTADHISARLCYSDLELSRRDSFCCISRDVIRVLYARLGASFIQHLNRDEFVIHQAVLMMLFAASLSPSAVELCKWPVAAEDLIALIQMTNPSRLVLIMSDSGFSAGSSWDGVFQALRFFDGSNIELCVYPSSAELAWSRHKLGDIRTFDAMAKAKQHWRPHTCFGLGDCTLLSTPQAIKRNYSCAAQHVEIMSIRADNKLRCTIPSGAHGRPGKQRLHAEHEIPGSIYFHQEAVHTFQSFGEFRVFVAAGRVTSILRTKFDWDSSKKVVSAWKVQLEDFKWYSSDETAQAQKREELEKFVLDVDNYIRQRREPGFKTIHMGGRYDCGITEETPNGRFFVNELTRPLSAATFPGCLAFPHTEILLPWAKSLVSA